MSRPSTPCSAGSWLAHPRNPHSVRTRYWGSQNFQKRLLDASGRVAFYHPCALIERRGRKVSCPASFPDNPCVLADLPASLRASAWLVASCSPCPAWSAGTGVKRLLILYLVFAPILATRYGREPLRRESPTGRAPESVRVRRLPPGQRWSLHVATAPAEWRPGCFRGAEPGVPGRFDAGWRGRDSAGTRLWKSAIFRD